LLSSVSAMKLCNVEGCSKPSYVRGWCVAHYHRWERHGSPSGGGVPPGSLPSFIIRAIEYQGNDCLLWPYSKRHGYGAITENGRQTSAHIVVCKATHGPRPSKRHEAAHSCGVKACVNPRHLRWATPKQNQADRVIHGTHNRGELHNMAKLNAEQVQAIRARTGQTQHEIASEFGVTRSLISYIRNRRSWRHIP
jgi:hypothetical protein